MSALKSALQSVLGVMPAQVINRLEYRRQSFQGFNERPVEYAFVLRQIAGLYPTTVLDVGTGTTALPHLLRNCGCVVTAIDNIRDFWPTGMSNRHYHVIDDDITKPSLSTRFDLVTCVSVLEHIPDHATAVANMFKLLNPGGHLILTCPYAPRAYQRNVYELPGSNAAGKHVPYATQSFSQAEVDGWCAASGARVVAREHWRFWTGEYWSLGEQLIPPQQAGESDPHQLACLMFQKS